MLDELLKYRIVIGQILSAIASISTLLVLENYAGWHPLFSVAAAVVVYLAFRNCGTFFSVFSKGDISLRSLRASCVNE